MATTVTVYFATNRQPLTDGSDKIIGFSSELGPIGGLDVRYGRAEVEVDLKKGTNTMVPGSLEIAAQKLIFAAGEAPVLGSKTIFDAIRADMTMSGPDGYWCSTVSTRTCLPSRGPRLLRQ